MKNLYINEAGKDEGRLTDDGQSFNYFLKDKIEEIVKKADEEGYSLREVELLVADDLGMEISRAIISRRRRYEAATREPG